jgi:hypothetical protein
MTRISMITTSGAAVLLLVGALTTSARVQAQAPAAPRTDTGDAAVAALVTEVRALRADLQAASRNQLRAQMLLGRVQMQEQRLAYLDKQRADAANAVAIQEQMVGPMRSRFGPPVTNPCGGVPAAQPEQKRDCEANLTVMRQQLEAQESREQQLRAQENDLTNALQAEQARWSDFNSRLDELEQSLR